MLFEPRRWIDVVHAGILFLKTRGLFQLLQAVIHVEFRIYLCEETILFQAQDTVHECPHVKACTEFDLSHFGVEIKEASDAPVIVVLILVFDQMVEIKGSFIFPHITFIRPHYHGINIFFQNFSDWG